MDGDIIPASSCVNMELPMEITQNTAIMQDTKRECPLCKSEVRLLFVNFNEKVMMCENIECDFPFGYEEMSFAKLDSHFGPDVEVASIPSQNSRQSMSYAGSIMSTTDWSEINKINLACELDESQFSNKPDAKSDPKPKEKTIADSVEIKKHLAEIKGLTQELNSMQNERRQLKNEKFIRNLKNLQEMSGVQLLRPEEMGLLRKEEPVIGSGELKIDIDMGNDNAMSTIKIAIIDKDGAEKGGSAREGAT